MGNYILKTLHFCLILSFGFIISCKNNTVSALHSNENPLQRNTGLSIFGANVEINSNLSYQTINIEKTDVTGEPIISYKDIVSYDTARHIITLSYSGDSLKNNIGQIGVYGKSFIVALDSQKMYGGWFWTPISSVSCQWVVINITYSENSVSPTQIKIELGYPSESAFQGVDPRNNRKIIDRLIKDKKAI